jgi:DNA repair protein RadC
MARRKVATAAAANGEEAGAPAADADDAALLALLAAGLTVRPTQSRETGEPVWRISGNTLAHRGLLRDAGGTWNRVEQAWEFADQDPSAALAGKLAEQPVAGPGHNSNEAPRPERPHYWGHRQRVRERVQSSGVESFQNSTPERISL